MVWLFVILFVCDCCADADDGQLVGLLMVMLMLMLLMACDM